MSATSRYLAAFAASPLDAKAFALDRLSRVPAFCLSVLEEIGSWPSSEPELAALQELYP